MSRTLVLTGLLHGAVHVPTLCLLGALCIFSEVYRARCVSRRRASLETKRNKPGYYSLQGSLLKPVIHPTAPAFTWANHMRQFWTVHYTCSAFVLAMVALSLCQGPAVPLPTISALPLAGNNGTDGMVSTTPPYISSSGVHSSAPASNLPTPASDTASQLHPMPVTSPDMASPGTPISALHPQAQPLVTFSSSCCTHMLSCPPSSISAATHSSDSTLPSHAANLACINDLRFASEHFSCSVPDLSNLTALPKTFHTFAIPGQHQHLMMLCPAFTPP